MSFLQEAHHFNVEQLNINAGGAGRHYDSTNFRDGEVEHQYTFHHYSSKLGSPIKQRLL
jgi:hypothetical protein